VEDEDCVPQEPHMRGNEKERMENPKVRTILIPKLQMKDKLLNDNCRKEKLVVHIEVEYDV
jgi:hypothetical protein